ncbi:hypothetical protein EW146_g5015 [Bondarzewia mesenterica]|uniref:Uncharacterized protein n=1 Tax=Bondarzewia mesenterica TaxID=1095465 RepID=A0A4S4LUU5_9AGAM|nr:hypothetical protein EW146_g5015 [Bondarzewia mesenterica]
MAPPARRRVSYIIPPPIEPVPRLQLPSHGVSGHGSIAPLLIPSQSLPTADPAPQKWAQHPRHRLGVACLALDTSTQLVGRPSPEGILYTGGRDGLVISWDLGIPMKPRKETLSSIGSMRLSHGHWDTLTGWGDDVIDEDVEEEDGPRSDGDILGDVKGSGKRRRPSLSSDGSIPFEQQWETDLDAFQEGKPSQFRQSTQIHTDWVNDILLCNYNQTVISASSDGSVKAWNPHSSPVSDPVTIGTHRDYVRCLGQSREQKYVASGSFDRTIKLWDLSRASSTSTQEPIITLNPSDLSGPKSSIYALAVDPYGHTIVSGGPERVVRIWDPRAGKRIGKLVGHTDNIRAILISEDSRYLLTASADASIKLWSLASQRCLHTFTHHTDSVWSLYSSHPSLEIFYSGDRSGFVCKVDVEGCTDMSEGECVVLCQDTNEHGAGSDGVNKIVAMDDNLVWTASGSSSLKRWRVPQRRSVRAATLTVVPEVDIDDMGPLELPFVSSSFKRKSRSMDTYRARPRSITLDNGLSSSPPSRPRHSNSMGAPLPMTDLSDSLLAGHEGEATWYGIPFESLVRLTSPHDPFAPYSPLGRGRDADVATLYSAASVMSVPRAPMMRSPLQSIFPQTQVPRAVSPVHSDILSSRAEETLPGVRSARAEFEEREVCADAVPLHSAPDETTPGEHGLVRAILLNDRIHALTVDTATEVAVWDIIRGVCLGKFPHTELAAASLCESAASCGSGGKEHSPREALEFVRGRIEGEAVVVPWSRVDTKIGVLTVHLDEKSFEAELYADEAGIGVDRHYNEEHRVNLGKWALRNLFLHFIREEQRAHSRRMHGSDPPTHNDQRALSPFQHELSHGASSPIRTRSSSTSSKKSYTSSSNASVIASPTLVPAVPPAISGNHRPSPLLTPKIPLYQPLSPIQQSPVLPGSDNDSNSTPIPRHAKAQTDASATPLPPSSFKENDYFSLRVRRPSVSSGGGTGEPDDFSGWGGPGTRNSDVPTTPSTPTAGGLMGRLKSLGKISKRPMNEPGSLTPRPVTSDGEQNPSQDPIEVATPGPAARTPVQAITSGTLNPPTSADGPTLPLNPVIPVMVAEEASPGWTIVYRGSVASTGADLHALEEAMPMWLLEFLLQSKAPAVSITKIGFVLLPYQSKEPDAEQLPELLNTAQSKLTASRFLRVRKLTYHVQDKIDKMSGNLSTATASPRASPRSSVDTHRTGSSAAVGTRSDGHGRTRPEETWEILCNDVVLPLDMTLAAVRQFIWRQSAELTMHYRRRRHQDQRHIGVTIVSQIH